MDKFAVHFPDLLSTLTAKLNEVGNPQLADDIRESTIRKISFDSDADAGTIALNSSRPLNVVEHTVIGVRHGSTIPVSPDLSLNIDVDNFGRVLGIEVLFPSPELRAKMVALAGI